MAAIDFESNRMGASFIAIFALVGCLWGSRLAFAVLCVAVADYHLTVLFELLAAKWERK